MIFFTTLCGILFWAMAIGSAVIFLANGTHTMRIGAYLASLFWVCLYLGLKLFEVATLLNESGLASW